MKYGKFWKLCEAAGGQVDRNGGKGSHAKVRFASGCLIVPTSGKHRKEVARYVLQQARRFGVSC